MLTKEKVWQLAEEAGMDKAKFASLVAKEGVSEELMDEELDNVCGGGVLSELMERLSALDRSRKSRYHRSGKQ